MFAKFSLILLNASIFLMSQCWRLTSLQLFENSHLQKAMLFSQCIISAASHANMLYIAVLILANVASDWELAFIHRQQKLIKDSSQAGLLDIHTNNLS